MEENKLVKTFYTKIPDYKMKHLSNIKKEGEWYKVSLNKPQRINKIKLTCCDAIHQGPGTLEDLIRRLDLTLEDPIGYLDRQAIDDLELNISMHNHRSGVINWFNYWIRCQKGHYIFHKKEEIQKNK